MDEAKLQTLAEIKEFLEGTHDIELKVSKAEQYGFIERVLKRFCYTGLSRCDKGVVLRYLKHMTGLSRQQVTRLVERYSKSGRIIEKHCTLKNGFRRRAFRILCQLANRLTRFACWPPQTITESNAFSVESLTVFSGYNKNL